MDQQHIVIIGNGIAGTTAARHIRKNSDHKITMISSETEYPYSRTALMYIYMGHMRPKDIRLYEDWFYPKNQIDLIYGHVEKVDCEQKSVELRDFRQDGTTRYLQYDQLVVATGSKPNKFGWPGQDLEGVRGMVSWQDLEYLENKSDELDQAVIVGGGLIGIELAEMLHTRGIHPIFLVREESYWNKVLPPEESAMINRHIREHGLELRLKEELTDILDDGNGHVRGVKTNKGHEIPTKYVGLTAGVRPNISFEMANADLEVERGILVDEHLRTSIPDVYAIGDCAQLHSPLSHRKPIEPVWYAAKMMGETVGQTIAGHTTTYRPGQWFNSAKFLDIEYQVYGEVPTVYEDSKDTLYWEHENRKQSIRIVYEAETQVVKGFNLMGVRFRHPVCDRWLEEACSIEYVLEHLHEAHFDPEFHKSHHQALLKAYQAKTGKELQPKKKRKKILDIF